MMQVKTRAIYSDGDSEDIFFEDPEIDIIVQNSGDALVSLVPEGDKRERKKKKLKRSTHNSSLCATSILHASFSRIRSRVL